MRVGGHNLDVCDQLPERLAPLPRVPCRILVFCLQLAVTLCILENDPRTEWASVIQVDASKECRPVRRIFLRRIVYVLTPDKVSIPVSESLENSTISYGDKLKYFSLSTPAQSGYGNVLTN